MAIINKPYTFSAGSTIVAAEHNSNFDTIYSEFNGSISNANISASANISDSKLTQLTTAGKVSGASFTLLGSIPSGGGVVPIANLATGTADGTKFIRDDGTLQVPSLTVATQAQMETATSTTVGVTPGRTQYHPGVCKAWVTFNGAVSDPTALASHNASSTVTRNGTGDYTVTWTTSFSSANYCVSFGYHKTGGQTNMVFPIVTKAAGSLRFESHIVGIGVSDSIDGISVVAFGDQ